MLRRWIVLISTTAIVAAGLIFGTYERTRSTPLERTMLGASVVLALLGWFARGTDERLLWLSAAATATLALTTLASGPDSTDWLPLVSAVSFTGYVLVLLLPRPLDLIGVPTAGLLLAWTWSTEPENAVSGALELLGGWPSVAQVMLGCAGLLWAWRLLIAEAAEGDVAVLRAEASADELFRRQARARVWRSTATRVHESVLNTIRYVQAVGTVDPDRLREQLPSASLVEPEPGLARRSTGRFADDVRAALAGDTAAQGSLVVREIADADLPAEVYEVLLGAGVELVRNAVRHGAARRVEVALVASGEHRLQLEVLDDGRGLAADALPGVGLVTVLGSRVADLGGTVAFAQGQPSGTRALVDLPVAVAPAVAVRGGFDQGRLLVTAPIAAQSVAALAAVGALAAIGEPNDFFGAAAAVACIVIAAAVVLRRHALAAPAAFLLALPAVLMPWLLTTSEWRCEEASAAAPVVNVSGFALIVLLAWSRPLVVGVPTVLVWAAGAVALTVEFDAGCREPVGLATLNSLIGLPIILGCVALALRLFRRAEQRARTAVLREAEESAAAAASADLDAALHSAVAEAVDALEAVADEGAVSPGSRRRLALADGRIRATIQLDPATAGTLALAVREGVEAAAALGRPVTVRALITSDDRRPLPIGLQTALRALLTAPEVADPVVPTVQAFTDGSEDHVSLRVGRDALHAAGMVPGAQLRFDDAVLDVDDDAGERGLVPVLVSRPCASR